MENYINRLISILEKKKLEALLVTSRTNIEYLSGFSEDGILLIIPGKINLLITDSRFIQEAYLLKDFKIRITNQKMPKFVLKEMKRFGLKKVGFEKNDLTYTQYSLLKKACEEEIELIPTNFVEEMRVIKNEEEIEKIKKAIDISISAFLTLFSNLKIGHSEKEIANRLGYLLQKKGADSVSFETIVATGENASKPHAKPTLKKWTEKEPLLIDWGAKIEGYNCDLTRVIFSYKIDHIYKKYYKILLEAQEKAISLIKPGIEAKRIDRLIRNYFKKYKLDKFFLHSSGHGIGKEVHEAPWISKDNNRVLKENMVFTIEPGIYIKGKFGLRIEDIVRVTGSGNEVLTSKLNKYYIK